MISTSHVNDSGIAWPLEAHSDALLHSAVECLRRFLSDPLSAQQVDVPFQSSDAAAPPLNGPANYGDPGNAGNENPTYNLTKKILSMSVRTNIYCVILIYLYSPGLLSRLIAEGKRVTTACDACRAAKVRVGVVLL